MPQVTFVYDKKQDIRNWKRVFSNNRNEIADALPWLGAKEIPDSENELQDLLGSLLSAEAMQNTIQKTQTSVEKRWRGIEKLYFTALEELTEQPVYVKSFTCALTTLHICPYDQAHDWFMVSVRSNADQQITNIAHEIFHLQFLRYYQNVIDDKDLSKQERFAITESFTVLLNTNTFQKFLPAEDKGYAAHEKRREHILALYRSGKNMPEIVRTI